MLVFVFTQDCNYTERPNGSTMCPAILENQSSVQNQVTDTVEYTGELLLYYKYKIKFKYIFHVRLEKHCILLVLILAIYTVIEMTNFTFIVFLLVYVQFKKQT